MLIIARRKGQRILLGDDVEVVVTELSKGVVKLGIVAPTTLTILRGETKDIADANRAAAGSTLDELPGAGARASAATPGPKDQTGKAPGSPGGGTK
jgi:carbon storage regulator